MASREKALETWNTLYRKTLPDLARTKAPSQPKWPVTLDHCFARIIFDSVVGRGERFESSSFAIATESATTPMKWDEKIKKPASKNMSESDLLECISMGEAIADGKVDLVELDRQSLIVRGKSNKYQKRKREDDTDNTDHTDHKLQKSSHSAVKIKEVLPDETDGKENVALFSPIEAGKWQQMDVRQSFHPGTPVKMTNNVPAAAVDVTLRNTVEESNLTAFRKRVLLALCQVPAGQVSSYRALSKFLASSPRAVGNALRNNPFAPQIPCHRIVAADGGIGGFGGSWGKEGVHYGEKVELLKKEGVRMNEDEGKIKSPIWDNFAQLDHDI